MIGARVRGWLKSDAPPSTAPLTPWELTLARAWPRAVLLAYLPIAIVCGLWSCFNAGMFSRLVQESYDTSATELTSAKLALFRLALAALPFSLLGVVTELRRERHGLPRTDLRWAPLALMLGGLPLLATGRPEYRYPYLVGAIVVAFAASVAAALAWLPWQIKLAPRQRSLLARWALVGGCLTFTAWIGFMAHWRFITFMAEPYDMSWETNAVHNIVHSGIPKTSVGAGNYYASALLPAPYAALHTPWIYYLFAPAYALLQDGRTLLWQQSLLMALGAVGVFGFARKVLRSELLGAAMALVYLLFPHVQLYCLHDLHANQLAIPVALLALGAMENGFRRSALVLVLVSGICREETAVYGIAIGLFWATSRRDRSRVRFGYLATASSLVLLLVITRLVMPLSGGRPRYDHFGFFFDGPGVSSLVKSYLLNPWGALSILLTSPRPEYAWSSLLPVAFLPLLGRRGAVLLLIPAGLLLPAGISSFFVPGINYGAPIVVPVIVMAVFGARTLIALLYRRQRSLPKARLMCAGAVLTCAVCCSVLYGNLFGKTYKLEFGGVPYRQANQYSDGAEVGIVNKLPAYGERERQLWDLIQRVPRGEPISTSWRINPQLSNREVSLLYPQLGEGHPAENRVKYVVIDRLPSLIEAPEEWERQLRARRDFEVAYENPSGIIFHRRD
jgi:uncharacterized membrane protein